MSLRVWLPLNGDLHNQGLSNVAVTNNGATVDNNGKIGKCYYFNGSSQIKISLPENMTTIKNTSITAWIKSTGSVVALGGISYDNNTYGYSGAVTLYTSGWQFPYASGYKYVSGGSIANSQVWHHVACTIEEDKIITYLDGSIVKEGSLNTLTAVTTLDSTKNFIEIGQDSPGGDERLTGYVNDFRVYDHALSAKEVKELSKGLVCHYTLNDIKGQENLFNWGNKRNEIITLNNYQNTGSFTQFSNCLTFDAKDTVGTTYTISFWAKSPNGTTSLLLYNNNSTPRYFYFSPTTLTTSLNNEWQYFTYTFINQDRGSGTTTASTYNRIEIYMPSKMGGQVKLIKIEEGDKATVWSPAPSDSYYSKLGYDSKVIKDSSGNNNNTITSKNIAYNSSTARNSTSAVFNGTDSFIACGRGGMITDEITINFWGYSKDWTKIVTLTSCTETGGFYIGRSNNNFVIYMGTGTASNTYKTITSAITVQTLSSDWHMFTVTYNGLDLKFYIDGILDKTNAAYTTKTPIFYNVSNGIFIGAEAGGNQTTPAGSYSDCQISDYRIYATALSADDVKQLYNTPISIAKNGSILTQGEYIE